MLNKGWEYAKDIPILNVVLRYLNLFAWHARGRPVPPPGLYKRRTLKQYAKRYGLKCFVETGTFYGETIAALKRDFDEIYSIELSEIFHSNARKRFSHDKHIKLVLGDSGKELPKLVDSLNACCLFWLDAHYSGGITARGEDIPIMKEIACILKDSKTHVILIDDMRLFGEDPEYPSNQALVAAMKNLAGSRYMVEVRDDLMRITPTVSA